MARPRTHTTELRDLLMASAVEVVSTEGFPALSLRSLAERAGTSTAAVYALFDGKEGLQRAVLHAGFDALTAAQRQVVDSEDPIEEVAGLGATYVQWAVDHPRLYEAMFGEVLAGMTPSAELHAARMQVMTRLSQAVQTALDDAIFRPADHLTVVTSLWAQVHGLATLIINGHLPKGADLATAAYATIEGWLVHRR